MPPPIFSPSTTTHSGPPIGAACNGAGSVAEIQSAPATSPRFVMAFLLFLVCAIALATFFFINFGLSELSFRGAIAEATDYIRSCGALAVAASIGLMVMHSVVPLPAEIIAAANCMVFGPYWGFIVTWVGAMIAAVVAFGVSRYLGRPLLRGVLSRRAYLRIDQLAARGGVPALILCRLIPLVSFNVINYAAGLMNVSWWTFIWTTAIGIIPGTLVIILVTESLLAGSTAMAVLCISAVLLVIVFWVWKRRRRLEETR